MPLMPPPPENFLWDFSVPVLLSLLLLFLGCFFLVLAVRQRTRYTRQLKKGEKAIPFWIYSLVMAFLFTSGAVLSVFLTETQSTLFSPFGLAALGFFLLFSILIQTFRKILGTLTALALIAALILAVLFIQSLHAFTGRTRIANIHVLETARTSDAHSKNHDNTHDNTKDGQRMTLLLESLGNKPLAHPVTISLQGERFGVLVYQVIFNDLAVFLGAKTRYAWLGMTAFNRRFEQTDLHLFPDELKRRAIFTRLENNELRLPFVRSVQADIAIKLAREKRHYAVYVENDGGITVEATEEKEKPGL